MENGNYAAHQELKTQSEIGSASEQTVITETTRTTQATIRMEHKQNFMDLPVTISQRTQTPTIPVVSEGTTMTDELDNPAQQNGFQPPPQVQEITKSWPPKQESAMQWPPKAPEHETFVPIKPQENGSIWPPKKPEMEMPQKPPQEVINVYQMQQNEMHVNENICAEQPTMKSAFKFFESQIREPSPKFEEKYTRYEDAMKYKNNNHKSNEEFASKLNQDLVQMNLERGPEPEMGYMPKVQVAHEKISDKVKKLEVINNQSSQTPVSGSVCVFPPQPKKQEMPAVQQIVPSQTSKTVTQQSSFSSQTTTHLSTGAPTMQRSASPKPSSEALAMERLWAPKSPVPFMHHTTETENKQFSHEQTSSFVSYSSQPMYTENVLPTLAPQIQPEEKPIFVQPPAQTIFKPKPISPIPQAPVQAQPPVPIFKPQPVAFQPQKAPVVFKPKPISPIPCQPAPALFKPMIPPPAKSPTFIQSQSELKSPSLVQQFEKPQEPFDQSGLQPGPPPTLCYAPKPKLEQRQSYVERIEKSLEANLERVPDKVPEGGIRLFPLMTQKKKSMSPQRPVSMPIPPKVEEFSQSKITNYDVTTKHETIFTSLTNLDEKPVYVQQPIAPVYEKPVIQQRPITPVQHPPAPIIEKPAMPQQTTPTIIQHSVTPMSQTTEQTDVSEDFNRATTPIWGYRHVAPPKTVFRPKSVEPVAMPPTQFEVPKDDFYVKTQEVRVEKQAKKESTVKQEPIKTPKPIKQAKPVTAPKPKYTFSPINQPNETYNSYKNFVQAEQKSEISESYFSQSQVYSSNQTNVDESKTYKYQAPPQQVC